MNEEFKKQFGPFIFRMDDAINWLAKHGGTVSFSENGMKVEAQVPSESASLSSFAEVDPSRQIGVGASVVTAVTDVREQLIKAHHERKKEMMDSHVGHRAMVKHSRGFTFGFLGRAINVPGKTFDYSIDRGGEFSFTLDEIEKVEQNEITDAKDPVRITIHLKV